MTSYAISTRRVSAGCDDAASAAAIGASASERTSLLFFGTFLDCHTAASCTSGSDPRHLQTVQDKDELAINARAVVPAVGHVAVGDGVGVVVDDFEPRL
jgi:hypothetical protein